jgi:hypothetical protein
VDAATNWEQIRIYDVDITTLDDLGRVTINSGFPVTELKIVIGPSGWTNEPTSLSPAARDWAGLALHDNLHYAAKLQGAISGDLTNDVVSLHPPSIASGIGGSIPVAA